MPATLEARAADRDGSRASLALASTLVLLSMVGAWLRFAALSGQAPFHDEWHALFAVRRLELSQLATRFGTADHSIPVALYLETLSRAGRLGDLALWLPGALASLGSALLLARIVARRAGREAGFLLGSLLLLSPALVYFARSARPYGWCAPLALLSVLALERYVERGGARAFASWLAAALAVAWALPIYLPFVAAPLLLYAIRPVPGPTSRAARRRAFGAMLAFGIAITAALAPPLLLDARSLAAKTSAGDLRWSQLGPAVAVALGGWRAPAFLGVLPLALLGLRRPAGDGAPRIDGLIFASIAQLAAVIVVRPAEISSPLVLGRYWLPAGLVSLLLASLATARLARRLPARARAPVLCAVVLSVGAGTWLPRLPWISASPDNFRSTKLYHLLFFAPGRLASAFPELPAGYRRVRDEAGEFAILELPYNGYLRTPYGYYQALHRREVYLGTESDWCTAKDTRELPPFGSNGYRLSRFVSPASLSELASRGIRFVIFHRDPESEVPWVAAAKKRRDRFDFQQCVERFERISGTPARLDGGLAIFDLGAVGASRSSRP